MSEIAVFVQNRPFLGAVLVHAPLVHALGRAYPNASVVVYAPFESARLLAEEGLADRFIRYHGARELHRTLCARRPDAVISMRRKSVRVGAAVLAAGVSVRIGFSHPATRGFLTEALPLDKRSYRAVSIRSLAAPLGVPPGGTDEVVDALAARTHWRPPRGSLYTFMPCGSDDRKQWGVQNHLALARAFGDRDPDGVFVFVLGPRERDAGHDAAVSASSVATRSTCLVDASIPVIARAVVESRIVVTNDCAPGHLAQMSRVPVISIHGNWDARAERRMGEWVHRRPRARALSAAAGDRAAEIPVRLVFENACELADASARLVSFAAGRAGSTPCPNPSPTT